ncbi:MAG: 16S rRNA (cytosine(967)-C(5))-methyltransferase RsmB [Desulfuromonadales bacterium]
MPANQGSQNPDVRQVAYQILSRVEQGSYADRLIDDFLRQSPPNDVRDRGLLTELVYGVLRLRGRLDFALGQVLRQPLSKLEPAARTLLRLGAYQLLELDRVPDHAAVDTTVTLARRVGMNRLTGLMNGCLRSLARQKNAMPWPTPQQPKAYLQHVCSLPSWLAGILLRQLPNHESRGLAEALAEPAPLVLRVNFLKTDRPAYLEALRETGHDARACRYAPEGVRIDRRRETPLPGDQQGWYQVQDEASMLIAHLLQARPEEEILDACAAPGGKATHLAALTQNRANILALDKHPQRLALLERGAARLGCQGIATRTWDLTETPAFLAPASFDRILVDAPCSGLGVLRRNPESRWLRQAADIVALADLQTQIIETVAPLVRAGGHLLYSVCTFTSAETDAVVERFLAQHPEFQLENLAEVIPQAWADLVTPAGTLRTWPHHHDGMDAFFAARFVKHGSG